MNKTFALALSSILVFSACATNEVDLELDSLKAGEFSFNELYEDGVYSVDFHLNGENLQTVDRTHDLFKGEILKETDENIYFNVRPDGLGGYILYGGAFDVYRINKFSGEVTALNPDYGKQLLTDISQDESTLIYTENDYEAGTRSILAKDANTLEELFRHELDSKWGQAGNGVVSSDNRLILFGASLGNPEDESSAVFMGEIETGLVDEIAAGDSYYSKIRWVDGKPVFKTENY